MDNKVKIELLWSNKSICFETNVSTIDNKVRIELLWSKESIFFEPVVRL